MVSAAFPNRPFELRENVWLTQQDIAGNRSQFGYELWVYKKSYSPTFSSGKANRSFSLNGTVVGVVNENGFDFQGAGPWLILTGTAWVNHASDGTLTLSIAGSADYDLLGATTVNASVGVKTIPRASTATFTGGSALTAGTAVTINTNRANSAFTHKVEYRFGDLTGTISSSAGASVSWTPPLSLLAEIPTALSGTGSIYVTTYQGSTQIGSRTTTGFTLNVPASVVPTIDPLTGTDTNPTVASVVGAYVQNLSRLKVGVTAAGAYGSTITATEVTVDGVKGSPSSSYALPTAGTRTISAKVTDSRGRTATRSATVPVLAYTPPSVSSANVRRATSAGVVNENQSYLRVDLNATVKSLVNSTERNGMTIKIRTRPTNGAWTNRNTITGALTYNNNFVVSGGAVFPPTSSFDVEISVTDKVGQSWTRVIALATSAATLDMVGTSVGIGKLWERGALDVGGDTYIAGNLDITGTMRAGSVPNARLTELSAGLTISTSPPVVADADLADTPGFYILSSSGANSPDPGQELSIQVIGNSTRKTQIATRIFGMARVYKRYRSGSPISWGAWQVTFDETSGDARMASGTGSHAAVGAVNGVTTTITFPSGRFSVAPRVAVTNAGDTRVQQTITAVSATSMTVASVNWTSGAATAGSFHWVATQVL